MYEEYQQEMQEIKAELRQLPKGNLVKRRNFYYCYDCGKEKGITKNHKLIAQLARKAYLKERLKRLAANAKAAEWIDKQYQELSPVDIIRALSNPYKDLPDHYFFRDFHDSWSIEEQEEGPPNPEKRIYLTNEGVRVRSKSEMAIGNALERRRIPYRYEAALDLGDITLYPDFTARRLWDGKLFFWEHFGFLGRPDYDEKNAQKLSTYARSHIFPGRDLICTSEEDIRDSRRIEGIIDLYFGISVRI